MANNLDPVTESLVFFGRSALAALKPRMVLASLVRNDYGGASGAPGLVVEIPNIIVEGDAVARQIGGAATASSISTHTRQLVYLHVYMGVKIDSLEAFIASIPLQEELASQVATGVARKCDSIVAGSWSEIPYEAGELDGTTAFGFERQALGLEYGAEDFVAEQRAARRTVCGPESGGVVQCQSARYADGVRERGRLEHAPQRRAGAHYGFDLYESQQIQNGTLSTAAQTNSPGGVVGAHAIGSTTLAVNAIGVGTVKAGTTFALGNFRYAVTVDTAITANAATLPINPHLKEAMTGGEIVTFTEHTAAGSMNLAFHPDAILALSRVPSAWPAGSGVSSVVVRDEQTDLGIRVSTKSTLLGGAGDAFATEIVADLLFGAKTVRPELAVKITGAP
jgi:hypothetical protein